MRIKLHRQKNFNMLCFSELTPEGPISDVPLSGGMKKLCLNPSNWLTNRHIGTSFLALSKDLRKGSYEKRGKGDSEGILGFAIYLRDS